MPLLAFDSAASHCSVAVVSSRNVLGEVSAKDTQTHSRHLMDRIHRVLSECRLKLSDMDAFAVTRGPGSFTGLRIALSTAKGLAVAMGKPVVTVSTLDALAFQAADARTLICPMLDARKGEVYFSRCRFEGGELVRLTEASVGPPEAAVSGIDSPCLCIGEGALRYQEAISRKLGSLARFPARQDHAICASAVGFLGFIRLKQKKGADPGQVTPVYLRGADVRKTTNPPDFYKKFS